MPSHFPGMDPFIESQKWRDCHTNLMTGIQESLAPRVAPRYVVDVEETEIHTLPQTRSVRQRYLRIRERRTNQIVTVIEVLSPTNKADGRREYLNKRNEILANAIHLVELDLLRGGVRLPTVEPLRPADYYAFVCRHQRLPEVEVYAWALRQPLPTIPVPLKDDDPDVPLDLQLVFTRLYDRAVYQYSLDYDLPVNPPLRDADAQWVLQVLETKRRNSGP